MTERCVRFETAALRSGSIEARFTLWSLTMAEAFMAYPELRNPFKPSVVNADSRATVLYQGRTIKLRNTGEGDGLLIDPVDLKSVNGFEIKPEGVCYGDLCIPLDAALMVEQAGQKWFSLTALAELLGQPFVADLEAGVWSFAEIPAKRENMMVNAMAPELELTDREGQVVRMADLKGKKALIVTWSSW